MGHTDYTFGHTKQHLEERITFLCTIFRQCRLRHGLTSYSISRDGTREGSEQLQSDPVRLVLREERAALRSGRADLGHVLPLLRGEDALHLVAGRVLLGRIVLVGRLALEDAG